MAEGKKLRITLNKSLIGIPDKQKRVVRALGLHRRGSTVTHSENGAINGMVFKVRHLLQVERVKK